MIEFLQRLRSLGPEAEAGATDLFGMSSDWFWIMDAELRYIYFSNQVEEVTGDPPEWHYGKTRQELGISQSTGGSPFDRREPFRNLLISRRNRSGRLIWIRSSGSPILTSDGAFLGYVGTGSDVTAEVEAHNAVEYRHTLFVKAMESMTDGFALFDPQDHLVFCNERFKELNPALAPFIVEGMTFEDMVRSNLAAGRILEAVGREDEFLAKRMAEHQSPSGEPVLSLRRDGRVLQVREVRLDDGSTFLINSDQTNLRQRETELERAKTEAEAASRAKSDFLANVSHELRTPLNAILGFSEIIMHNVIDASRHAEYAAAIHNSGRHLLSLINDLLDLNAIESGRRTMMAERTDLRELASGVLKTVHPIAKDAGVSLRGRVPDDLPALMLDRRAIEQCLLNLLSNAIKFSHPGQAVYLTVSSLGASGVEIAVSDMGIGMAAETIKAIGEPFADAGPQAARRGAGLGLAITKTMVEAMGGHLSIRSAPDHGTHASIWFPASLAAAAAAG